MIFPSSQKRYSAIRKSLVRPKQRAKLRILAEIDKQKHGEWSAFTNEEIGREEFWLPYEEKNEIYGWLYIARTIKHADQLAARLYYEYQSLNNQLLLSMERGNYQYRSITNSEIEKLTTGFADFIRHVYFLLLLNHVLDDVYDQYLDLESIKLLEKTVKNSSTSWLGLLIPLREITKKMVNNFMGGNAIFYDLLAQKIEVSGINLMARKNINLSWLRYRVDTIFEQFSD